MAGEAIPRLSSSRPAPAPSPSLLPRGNRLKRGNSPRRLIGQVLCIGRRRDELLVCRRGGRAARGGRRGSSALSREGGILVALCGRILSQEHALDAQRTASCNACKAPRSEPCRLPSRSVVGAAQGMTEKIASLTRALVDSRRRHWPGLARLASESWPPTGMRASSRTPETHLPEGASLHPPCPASQAKAKVDVEGDGDLEMPAGTPGQAAANNEPCCTTVRSARCSLPWTVACRGWTCFFSASSPVTFVHACGRMAKGADRQAQPNSDRPCAPARRVQHHRHSAHHHPWYRTVSPPEDAAAGPRQVPWGTATQIKRPLARDLMPH